MITMIESREEIDKILDRALVGRLGLSTDGEPYVVPLHFAHQDQSIFLHCGLEGRKLDMIAESPRVCFEVDELLKIVLHDQPCLIATHYYSVIAWGTARLLDDVADKKKALDLLVKKYGEQKEFEEPPSHAYSLVSICEIQIDRITAKASLPD